MTFTERPALSPVLMPLSAAQIAEAGQVAARLRAELGRLVLSLPPESRGASAMSRATGVLRVTCQRVLGAISGPDSSPEMLARLPGVEGLGQFVEGFARTGAPSEDLIAARAAVAAFERLISTTGGSHTKLCERIRGGGGQTLRASASRDSGTSMPDRESEPAGALATPEQRRELFRAAAAVTGRKCRLAFSIYAFAPRDGKDGNETTLERVLVKGLLGSAGVPGGMPFVLASGHTKAEAGAGPLTLDRGAPLRENSPEAVLKPFTSDPMPSIVARGAAGNVYQVIDTPVGGAPFDIVTALRASSPMTDPATNRPTLSSVWSLVSCPSESLILDVYLHASLERRFRPGLECLLWQAELDIPPERRWNNRVPNPPRLQLLGRGTSQASTDLHPRHAELTESMFEHAGMNAHDFFGFRCEVRWPVWRAGYCMTFDEAKG